VFALGDGLAGIADLGGWAAWLAIAPDGTLRAGRDAVTPLHYAYIKTWQAYVLTTQEGDLRAFLQSMGLKAIVLPLQSNVLASFSRAGALLRIEEHAGLRKPEPSLNTLACRALGRDVFTPTFEAEANQELQEGQQGGGSEQWKRVADWEREYFHLE
jgi:hypothetical protein